MHLMARLMGSWLLILPLLLAACDQDSDSTPEATPEVTPEAVTQAAVTPEITPGVTDDAEATGTPEVTSAAEDDPITETPAATPLVDDTATEIVSVSAGGEYYIAVLGSFETMPEGVPAPPAGSRWFAVTATLANQTGAAVSVSAESLTLIDAEGERYAPEAPDEFTQPPLVGAALTEGTSVLGLARFALPEGAEAALLEWCPAEDCDQPLQAVVPSDG